MDSKASEPSDSLVGTQSQIENVHSRGGKGAGDNDLEKDTTVTIDQDQESNVTDEGPQKWNFKAVVAMISLSMTFVGVQAPLFFIVGPLEYIAADLTGVGNLTSWIPISYTLAAATPVPFAGYMQDIFGRRWVTLGAVMVSIVGAIVIGTAHTFSQIVAGSALAGFGAGIAELGAIAGVSEVVPVKHRGYINGLMLVLSLLYGPYVLYGQLLASRATWRWGMWVSCIWCGITIVGLFFTYHPTKHSLMKGLKTRDILKRIDWVGGVLLTTGFTLFLVACQSGGYTHPWSSAYVLCLLLFGIAAIAAFVIYELFVPAYPLLPRELLRRKTIPVAFVVAFVSGMYYYGLTNFGPIYFSNVYASDPLTIGLRNTPFPTMVLAGAITGNFLISRFPRHIAYIMAGYSALTTLAGGLFILGNPTNPRAVTAFAALAGLGVGGIVVPVATVCVVASPDHLIATTVALTLAVRILGGTIGSSIYYNIFTSKLTAKLPALVAAYALEAGLPESSLVAFVTGFLATPPDPSIATLPGVTAEVIAAATLGTRWAFADSLKFVFIASIPFGVLATVCSLFLRGLDKYMSNRVVAHLVE